MRRIALFLLALPPLALLHSQESVGHSVARLANPFNTPADRAAGAAYYRAQCAPCHGADGKGGAAGPNLVQARFRHATSDEAMFRVIARGIPGSPMPASSLNGRPIWQIVAYVRSFADQSAAAGNPQRGAALFVQFNCAGCHNGAAPDLAAAILGPAEIRQSILEPNARVAPEYWRVSAVSASGETIEGLRLNEDTFTLQLLTREGALRTLHRDALREIKYLKTSPMPSFQGKIPAAALDDLTAYIQSLRDPVR